MTFISAHFLANLLSTKVCFWQNNYLIFIQIYKMKILFQNMLSIINVIPQIHVPTWSLAQPFRVIAHNGEINT